MRQLLVFMALGLFLGADAPKDDGKKDKEKLQGKAVTAERRGESKEDEEDHRLIFDGDKFRIKRGDQTIIQGTFKVDPSKKPKEIDMEITEDQNGEHKGKTAPGIFALDGDTLRTCDNAPDLARARPAAFAAKSGSGHVLITFKRVKR